jgi:hypothetical protein
MSRNTWVGAIATLVVAVAGCTSEIEPERTATPAETTPAAETPAPASRTGGTQRPSGSTLGKARDTAKGTVQQLEDRDKELQKQLEDQ